MIEAQRLDAIEKRIADTEAAMSSPLARVRRDLREKKVFGATMFRVPRNYYDMPIADRAANLKSAVPQLCKSIVLVNTACRHNNIDDPTDSKYYCILIQYDQKLNSERLKDFVHKLRPEGERIPKKKFNFQLAPEAASNELTGFVHNAVCPFGLAAPLPMIVCEACLRICPQYVWMGAGEVDVKLGLPVMDFVRSTGAIVADISEPRTDGTIEN